MELELQMVVPWELGIEPGSSTRATSALIPKPSLKQECNGDQFRVLEKVKILQLWQTTDRWTEHTALYVPGEFCNPQDLLACVYDWE